MNTFDGFFTEAVLREIDALPRWEPFVVIDSRWFEDDDD